MEMECLSSRELCYNIDEENGFVFKGKITHLTSLDFNDDKAFYYYTYDKHIEKFYI